MLLMLVPLMLLYELGIVLARLASRRRDRRKARAEVSEAADAS
jgi:Sec-independent protein secretion pathway component TatC